MNSVEIFLLAFVYPDSFINSYNKFNNCPELLLDELFFYFNELIKNLISVYVYGQKRVFWPGVIVTAQHTLTKALFNGRRKGEFATSGVTIIKVNSRDSRCNLIRIPRTMRHNCIIIVELVRPEYHRDTRNAVPRDRRVSYTLSAILTSLENDFKFETKALYLISAAC
ncbi:hypothetical protein PUN28_015860 [Cardiocondyla obscurior]|uniref:Uncharacterized protein n=1 Tax=Cardiocondyla obscurior TaxID=286306 RepID=A0AAW2EQV8_9HYME